MSGIVIGTVCRQAGCSGKTRAWLRGLLQANGALKRPVWPVRNAFRQAPPSLLSTVPNRPFEAPETARVQYPTCLALISSGVAILILNMRPSLIATLCPPPPPGPPAPPSPSPPCCCWLSVWNSRFFWLSLPVYDMQKFHHLLEGYTPKRVAGQWAVSRSTQTHSCRYHPAVAPVAPRIALGCMRQLQQPPYPTPCCMRKPLCPTAQFAWAPTPLTPHPTPNTSLPCYRPRFTLSAVRRYAFLPTPHPQRPQPTLAATCGTPAPSPPMRR